VELVQHVKPVDHAQLVLQPLILELYVELQFREVQLLLSQQQHHSPHLQLIIVVLVNLI